MFRLKFEIVLEYEPDPANYPDPTPEQMLAIDLANANEDPFAFISEGEWTITGEICDS